MSGHCGLDLTFPIDCKLLPIILGDGMIIKDYFLCGLSVYVLKLTGSETFSITCIFIVILCLFLPTENHLHH